MTSDITFCVRTPYPQCSTCIRSKHKEVEGVEGRGLWYMEPPELVLSTAGANCPFEIKQVRL